MPNIAIFIQKSMHVGNLGHSRLAYILLIAWQDNEKQMSDTDKFKLLQTKIILL